ncbi:unnamed protein product [Gongylonema pulchrum]|uniref:ANK_REP_REGION domain-containing protein n=1 Tax=Gongylonema pulchrum TaxID=637853 RepID=A0A183DVP1_9BILA|nr:unnamed protein product [Gongylonema pulchrum]
MKVADYLIGQDNYSRGGNGSGLSLIHVAVCKERHEIVEYLASAFPKSVDILDVNGRAAIHYAAIQQNAIYDTLIDCGANELLADRTGLTAAQYRENPRTTLSVPSPLMSAAAGLTFNRFLLDENLYDPGNANFSSQFLSKAFFEKKVFILDAPSESDLNQWLLEGNVDQLEQVLLDGRGHLLADRTSTIEAVNEFLNGIPKYQSKIDAIHKAVEEGDVRRVKSLIDREQLSTARNKYGNSVWPSFLTKDSLFLQ